MAWDAIYVAFLREHDHSKIIDNAHIFIRFRSFKSFRFRLEGKKERMNACACSCIFSWSRGVVTLSFLPMRREALTFKFIIITVTLLCIVHLGQRGVSGEWNQATNEIKSMKFLMMLPLK